MIGIKLVSSKSAIRLLNQRNRSGRCKKSRITTPKMVHVHVAVMVTAEKTISMMITSLASAAAVLV